MWTFAWAVVQICWTFQDFYLCERLPYYAMAKLVFRNYLARPFERHSNMKERMSCAFFEHSWWSTKKNILRQSWRAYLVLIFSQRNLFITSPIKRENSLPKMCLRMLPSHWKIWKYHFWSKVFFIQIAFTWAAIPYKISKTSPTVKRNTCWTWCKCDFNSTHKD